VSLLRNGVIWRSDMRSGAHTFYPIDFDYESSDCTGTPYDKTYRHPQAPLVPNAAWSVGDPVYRATGPQLTITFRSYLWNGTCSTAGQYPITVKRLEAFTTVPAPFEAPLIIQ
jgi:hypothetical protein